MVKRLSLLDHHPYPHIEVTRELFPRFLATRSLNDTGVDYFGAFLTKTPVRILIDFLNRVFRLRSCDVDIDGSFPVPCTQYFRKRCLAPCVSRLCTPEQHNEAAEALRLFLKNDREGLLEYVDTRIDNYSQLQEFERAAFYRDMRMEVEKFWKNPRLNIWLDESVDTFDFESKDGDDYIFMVTTRGRYMLAKSIIGPDLETDSLAELIEQLYQFYLPKEIRVSNDFPGRRDLAKTLSLRFDREFRIVVVHGGATQTASRALARTRSDMNIEIVRKRIAIVDLARRLQAVFGLKTKPNRIEAIDVAHISGTGMVGAASVWAKGKFVRDEYGFAISRAADEVSAISDFAKERYADRAAPDLLVVDGGKSQLKSATLGLSQLGNSLAIVSAVKPRGKHSGVSHFLAGEGTRIEFDPDDPGHRLLQRLRDDAHELANQIHAEYRDARHFYESSGTTPLVVPIRFTSSDGSADDIRPIETKNRTVETKRRTRSGQRGLYRPLRRA